MCGIFAYIGSIQNQQKVWDECDSITHRGPDNSRKQTLRKGDQNVLLGFHRLSINDLTDKGNQPFNIQNITMICNGEIYNHKKMVEKYGIELKSDSDCEVILHLYLKFGFEETIKMLDGVFAIVLYDKTKEILYAARDPIGVRSMYMGLDENSYGFCSELKGIHNLFKNIIQFKPGCTWDSATCKFLPYYDHRRMRTIGGLKTYDMRKTFEDMQHNNSKCNIDGYKSYINATLTDAVEKRIISDRPIGCLLSGGLDSSLVAALLAKKMSKTNQVLKTFSVGLEGAPDLKYAKMVAEHIGSEHHELILTEQEMLAGIEPTIKQLETYDTTTIRAGTPMFLLANYIKANFDTTVIFSGEGSDEASGSYMYFHNHPSEDAFRDETLRLIKDLHYFDVLRCDKSIAGAGLEVRVPFLDKDFLYPYMLIDVAFKSPLYGNIEKNLLRKSFDNGLLPDKILWRSKEGMSDGVSSKTKSWYSIIQDYADTLYDDTGFESGQKKYSLNTPQFKEALYFRDIFNKYYPTRDETIPYYWLPKWSGDIVEPSARVLSVYK
jgi:asparagine synthase (glutamine-hydrolysing)